MLTAETDLDIIGISPSDQLELVQEIRRIRPDVVMLDGDSGLTDPAELLTFLEDSPKLRLLVVSANDHLVRIYNKEEVLAAQASQLVDIIRHG